MARLNNWISPNFLHALGWTLVHSLWQLLVVAALAAMLIALFQRPTLRYIIGVCALVLMLAAPAMTLFVLLKSDTMADTPANALMQAAPVTNDAIAAPALALGNSMGRAMGGLSVVTSSPGGLSLQRFLPWLVGAWLCGVMLFSLRFAGGFLLLEHRRRTQSFPPDARILSLCRQVQQQLGLSRAIRYLECGWLEAPAAMGWLRPVILLPVTALTGLDEDQLRAVIAHELAHIRRWDFQVNLFQILVETLLFYHPAVWWLNRRIRAERELCCDEIAVAITGNRLVYAQALASMAEWKSVSVLAMAANRGSLRQRVLYVLGQQPFSIRQRAMGLTGGIVFLSAALFAANALFGIAYPVPAQASENPKPFIAATPIAPLQPVTPNPVLQSPPQAPVAKSEDRETANATPRQRVITKPSPSENPTPPSADIPLPSLPNVETIFAANTPSRPATMTAPDAPTVQPATPDPAPVQIAAATTSAKPTIQSRPTLMSGLLIAQAQCPTTGSMTELAYCLDKVDNIFWRSHQLNGSLAGFEQTRLGLARDFDSGEITKTQFFDDMAKANKKLTDSMAPSHRFACGPSMANGSSLGDCGGADLSNALAGDRGTVRGIPDLFNKN